MTPERYGNYWRIVMPDGMSLFDQESGYPRVWKTKRDALAFIAENPDAQQPKWPEPTRPLVDWTAA